MKAFVLLLACLPYLGGLPAEAQELGESQGFKVYEKDDVIYLSNLDGNNERKLADGYSPALSPDRKHIAYINRSDLYLINLKTEEKLLLVNNAAVDSNMGAGNPQWHPNGKTIFFDFGSIDHLLHLYTVEIDGANLRLIVEFTTLANAWPSPFSPDGGKFLGTSCFDQCFNLLLFDLDTASDTRIELSSRTAYGAWSPDGLRIAFGGGPNLWGEDGENVVFPGLFVANVDDGQVRTNLEEVHVDSLSWSLDSARIAFTHVGEDIGPVGNTGAIEEGGVYEVGMDGTGLRSRNAHFDEWEFSTVTVVGRTSERTWGQIKAQQRKLHQ